MATKPKAGSPSNKKTAPKSKSKSAASAPATGMTKAEFRQAEADLNKATRAAAPHVAAKQPKPPKLVPVQLVTAAGKPTTLEVPKAIANKLNKATVKKTVFKTADAEVSMRGTNAQIAEVTVKIPKVTKPAKVTKQYRTAAEIRGGAVDLAIDIRKAARELPVSAATKKAINDSAKAMDKVVKSIDSDMTPKELFKQRPAGAATRPTTATNPPHDRKSLEHEQKLERERKAKAKDGVPKSPAAEAATGRSKKPTRPDVSLAPKPTARVEDLRTNDGVLAPKPEVHGNDLKAQALRAMGGEPVRPAAKQATEAPARAGGIRSELDQKARNAILGAQ